MKRTVAAFPGLSVFCWWTGISRRAAPAGYPELRSGSNEKPLPDQRKGIRLCLGFFWGCRTSVSDPQALPPRHGQAMENTATVGTQGEGAGAVHDPNERGCVYHSLTTPYGVEKPMDNSLHRTGGVAPP